MNEGNIIMMDDFDEGWIYRSKNADQWMQLTDDAAELTAERNE